MQKKRSFETLRKGAAISRKLIFNEISATLAFAATVCGAVVGTIYAIESDRAQKTLQYDKITAEASAIKQAASYKDDNAVASISGNNAINLDYGNGTVFIFDLNDSSVITLSANSAAPSITSFTVFNNAAMVERARILGCAIADQVALLPDTAKAEKNADTLAETKGWSTAYENRYCNGAPAP